MKSLLLAVVGVALTFSDSSDSNETAPSKVDAKLQQQISRLKKTDPSYYVLWEQVEVTPEQLGETRKELDILMPTLNAEQRKKLASELVGSYFKSLQVMPDSTILQISGYRDTFDILTRAQQPFIN